MYGGLIHFCVFTTEQIELLYNNLCETHKKTRFTPEGAQWPPNQPKSIVNVALIHYKGERTEEQLLEIAIMHKEGSGGVDKLFSSKDYLPSPKKRRLNYSKISKSITDIFLADPITGELPKSILIEGAPGIGKTVLAKEIAYQWTEKKMLCDTKLVFLMYLRDPRIQKVSSLEQLLILLCSISTTMASTITDYITQCNGANVAFLIDGYDEYPATLRKDSFIADIIKHKVVSKSLVVVTSRPIATAALHSLIDRRIEILGFEEEDRKRYISESLSTLPGKESELYEHLKKQPTIDGLCFVPLHLAILLYLFKLGSFPKTLTEMNESFIVHTVYRCLNKHEYNPCRTVSKLADLPQRVLDFIQHRLSKLAFEGLQKKLLVFTWSEIVAVCPDISDSKNGFDLLQAVEHYPSSGAAGTTASFNFLHYTMQEFLAALHVSTLSDEEQSSLMKKTFWDEQFNFMWTMYVGIVGINSKVFNNFISNGQEYKNGSMKLVDSIAKDKRKRLHLFQCYLEAKSDTEIPNIIASMFRDGTIKFNQTLLPYHISSLLSFLSHSQVCLNALELTKCHLREYGMNILKQFIINNKQLTSTIKSIDLRKNDSSPWSLYCATIEHCSVDSLTVFGDNGMEKYVNQIGNSLEKNTTLQSLTLCDIGESGLKSIKTVFDNHGPHITLKEINLTWLESGCSNVLLYTTLPLNNVEAGISASKDIAIKILWNGTNNSTSDSLDLSDKLDNDNEILLFIAFGLHNNKTLFKLDLSNNKCFSNKKGATAICDCLSSNNMLKEFYLVNNYIGNKAQMIVEALQLNKTLQKLDISNNKICDDGVATISECKIALKEFVLSNNSITNLGAKNIAKIFEINKSIQKFNISCNEILYDGAAAISSCLKNNTTLQELDISNNRIESDKENESSEVKSTVQDSNISEISNVAVDGIKIANIFQVQKLNIANNKISSTAISNGIKNNNFLQELNISENNITNTGVAIIAEAITKNSVLKKLDISRNWITGNGLLQLLKAECMSLLKTLIITHNNVPKSCFKKIEEFILQSSLPLKIHVSWNEIVLSESRQVKFRSEIFLFSNSKKSYSNNDVWPIENISDLDYRVKFLGNCLKEDVVLQQLDLSNTSINSVRANIVASAIKLNVTLQKLDISNNTLSDEGASVFSKYLRHNKSLQELSMSENNITHVGAKKIAEVMKVNSTLLKFDISKNWICSKALFYLLEAIKYNNSALQYLNITHNNVNKSDFIKFQQYTKQMSLKIELSWNAIHVDSEIKFKSICTSCKDFNNNSKEDVWPFKKISDHDVRIQFLCNCLNENNSLQKLDLCNNGITDVGVTLIAETIEKNTTLQILNISQNGFSDDGVEHICSSLRNNKSLQELDMSENKISCRGANEIAQLIGINKSLKVLDISYMDIHDDGITAISEGLKSNRSLEQLNVSLNKITGTGAKEMAEAIKENKSLQKLNITSNKISDDGTAFISNCLKYNHCLRELYMSGNNITSEGAKHIANAIIYNKGLHTLHIHHHTVDDTLSFNMTILAAVHYNDTLKQLKLPWVCNNDEKKVNDEVKKINKKRTKRAVYNPLTI